MSEESVWFWMLVILAPAPFVGIILGIVWANWRWRRGPGPNYYIVSSDPPTVSVVDVIRNPPVFRPVRPIVEHIKTERVEGGTVDSYRINADLSVYAKHLKNVR